MRLRCSLPYVMLFLYSLLAEWMLISLQVRAKGQRGPGMFCCHAYTARGKRIRCATLSLAFIQVVLRVAPSDVFWSHSTPSFSSPYSCFQYLNLHAYGKTGCILAHLFPPASVAIDSLTDKEVSHHDAPAVKASSISWFCTSPPSDS